MLLADADYYSDANVRGLAQTGPELVIATALSVGVVRLAKHSSC